MMSTAQAPEHLAEPIKPCRLGNFRKLETVRNHLCDRDNLCDAQLESTSLLPDAPNDLEIL